MNSSQIICKKIYQIRGAEPNETAGSDLKVNLNENKNIFIILIIQMLKVPFGYVNRKIESFRKILSHTVHCLTVLYSQGKFEDDFRKNFMANFNKIDFLFL